MKPLPQPLSSAPTASTDQVFWAQERGAGQCTFAVSANPERAESFLRRSAFQPEPSKIRTSGMNQAGVGSMIPVSAPRQVRLIPDLRSYPTARAIRTNQTGVTSTSESNQAGQQERPPQRNDYGGKYDIIC